jgi:hypothetical protein
MPVITPVAPITALRMKKGAAIHSKRDLHRNHVVHLADGIVGRVVSLLGHGVSPLLFRA